MVKFRIILTWRHVYYTNETFATSYWDFTEDVITMISNINEFDP